MKNYKNIAVITPSYKEDKNIEVLLEQINIYLPGTKVFIVDDSNIYDNKKIAKIVARYRNATLISRFKKMGRGSAIITGFKEALKVKSLAYFFEMDSDLAHSPKESKRYLLKLKEKKYDLVIGSRYLKGAKTLGISFKRKILSVLVNRFLYFWLNVKISDFTSGFRLYSRQSVEYLTGIELKAKGFITLSESVYRLTRRGFLIGEVPITINNIRRFGSSTVNSNELINSLTFVLRMRSKDLVSQLPWKLILLTVFIFLFAFILRINTLNQIGRTWDEFEYIEQGYKMDELLLKGKFSDSFFYTTYDHPPLAKYIYGITAHLDKKGIDKSGNPIFSYDYTYSRLLSAIFGSLSAVLVLLIAWEYISPFVGISSGIIFSTLPFFIGLSQLVTTESFLMFLFTSSVYSFIKLFKNFSFKKIVLTGILTGLALEVKQSNGLLFPLFGLIYLIWYFKEGRRLKEKVINNKLLSLIWIALISVIVFVVLWPMPYFHMDVISSINQKIWLVKTSPPTVFWGKLILSPKIYFVTLYFITTPVLIILLFLVGLKKIQTMKKWIPYAFIIWFLFPFIQSFYPWRVHGVRYIIEIYAPLSIIAGAGLAYIIEKLKLDTKAKITSIVLITLYMFSIIYQMKPYSLDYFNEIVGGPKGIYNKGYFELGWWGQGLREAGYYLRDNAKSGSTIGLYVSPLHVFPQIDNQKLIFIDPNKQYNSSKQYDYVVVNYFHVSREGFDDPKIKQDYKLIHQVMADGAPLVDIYKSK